jgi:hypothetical protein
VSKLFRAAVADRLGLLALRPRSFEVQSRVNAAELRQPRKLPSSVLNVPTCANGRWPKNGAA